MCYSPCFTHDDFQTDTATVGLGMFPSNRRSLTFFPLASWQLIPLFHHNHYPQRHFRQVWSSRRTHDLALQFSIPPKSSSRSLKCVLHPFSLYPSLRGSLFSQSPPPQTTSGAGRDAISSQHKRRWRQEFTEEA